MFHCLGRFHSVPLQSPKFPHYVPNHTHEHTHATSRFLIGYVLGDLSASDTSLADLHERHRLPPPELGLMPLPDTDTDSGLDWTHLVDVANAYEGERRPQRSEPISLLFTCPPQLCYSFAQSICPSSVGGRGFYLVNIYILRCFFKYGHFHMPGVDC